MKENKKDLFKTVLPNGLLTVDKAREILNLSFDKSEDDNKCYITLNTIEVNHKHEHDKSE